MKTEEKKVSQNLFSLNQLKNTKDREMMLDVGGCYCE